jgi:hypothetical protein
MTTSNSTHPPNAQTPATGANILPPSPAFSIFNTCKATTPSGQTHLKAFLRGVRHGEWRGRVENCRNALRTGGEADYTELRESLIQAVSLSVLSNTRAENATPEERGGFHSGLLQIDVDAKEHIGMDLQEMRKIVQEAPFVVACFVSLSGKGIKGIARIPADFDAHAGSFEAARLYFEERGIRLDVNTKDKGRLCYCSFDPDLFYNKHAVQLEPVPIPERDYDQDRANSMGTEDPEHVRRVLAKVAAKIGPAQKRSTWLHLVGATQDAVGADAAGDLMDQFFPPQAEDHQSACDVLPLKGNWNWSSMWKYGVDPVDHIKDMPDMEEEAAKPDKTKPHSMIVWGVNSFPTTVPPETVILGNAWLRRADIAHLISTAGAGKSVAMIQAAMAWALGLPYFGIRPPQPLRILLFSGEDDRVTLGQCREGFLEHSKAITGQKLTAADLEPLNSMLRTEFSREHVGGRFHTHLARLLTETPADLVIVNPLLSYVGGEIVACASDFLRAGLMPVLQQHDCAALLAHHTGKMAKDGWDNTDDTYSGIGGGEVANVPRTILVLRPTTAEGLSVVKVCKRKTTGWIDADGNFTTSYFVKQSKDPERPAWIPVSHGEAQELVSGSKSKGGTGNNRRKVMTRDVVEALTGGPMNRQNLIASLRRNCDCSEKPAKDAIDSAEFEELVSSFSERNPNGGKEIKWFRIADDGEQGVG